MSNQVKVNKKKARLGRGISSLISENTKIGDFAEKEKPLKKTLKNVNSEKKQVLTKVNFQANENPSLNSGFEKEQLKVPDTARIWTVNIAKVHPNPNQPRKVFHKESLKELAASIKEKGILQPVVCRKVDNDLYEIIAGERRWRATQYAGLHELPIIIKETSNQEALELALIENIQRQDLNPVEEAEAYYHLIKEYNLTQQQLAYKMGKDRATIANLLRILNLGPEVKQMLTNREISMGQAKLLLSLSDLTVQKKVAVKIVKEKLSVRATEKLIKAAQKSSDNIELEVVNENLKFVEELKLNLQKTVGTKVSIDYNKSKGKMSFYFYSDDELNYLAEKVKTAWNRKL